jgi:polyisoprenoid-binding protein YceI
MATKTETTRNLHGKELPPPGRWIVDTAHSEIQFIARHMMISRVRGRFREFSATIDIAEDPEQSSVVAAINAESIDTGDPERDRHLRSEEFLDVEHYPEIMFRSTSVRAVDDRWHVVGDLTIRNVTKSITIDVEYCGVAKDPWGNLRAGFLGSTEINREEFAVTWNQVLESGGFVVGKGVKVEIDVEAVYQSDN